MFAHRSESSEKNFMTSIMLYTFLYFLLKFPLCILCSFEIKFNKKSLKDALGKLSFYAYIISRKWRASQWKKLQCNVSQVKKKPTYQNSAIFEHFQNGQKI